MFNKKNEKSKIELQKKSFFCENFSCPWTCASFLATQQSASQPGTLATSTASFWCTPLTDKR